MTIDVVVADDLTGVADTLVQFLPRAERCVIYPSLRRFERVVELGEIAGASLAIGVSTESRQLGARAAARRVTRAHVAALQLEPRLLYQKVDSALRGNPGAEVAAYRRATGATRVVLCPAFLPSGRTVRDGVLYVYGLPLAESPVGRDVRSPARESAVAAILQRQTRTTIARFPGGTSAPPDPLTPRVAALGLGILVADAESDRDLSGLALSVLDAGLLHAVSGSAGLAGALAELLPGAGRRREAAVPTVNRTLVVFGSPQPLAMRQLSRAASEQAATIHRVAPGDDLEQAVGAARSDLEQRGLALLAGPLAELTQPEAPATIARILAACVRRLLLNRGATALVLSGGDIAAATCAALRVDRLELVAQIFPGAPVSRIHGGSADGILVVTKSGSHGDEGGLSSILERVEAIITAGRV